MFETLSKMVETEPRDKNRAADHRPKRVRNGKITEIGCLRQQPPTEFKYNTKK